MVNMTPRTLIHARKDTEHGARLDGPQNLLEFFGEGTNLLPLQGFKPQTVQPVSLVSISTTLPGILGAIYLHTMFQSDWKIRLLG